MDQKKLRFLKGLASGLVIAAMVFAFLIAGIRIFGVQVYGVLTGSMEPAYPTGSLIYVKKVDVRDLRVNDVITFSLSPGVIATHRIVEIVPDEQYPTILRYRTKGDANREADASLVSANNIIGKAVFSVPQLGYVANYIQHPPGIYVAILLCGLMIAFVFYTDSLENKLKKQAGEETAGDKPGFDFANAINQLSQKLFKRDIIQKKTPPEPASRQGYVPRQQSMPPQSPQQQYPTQYQQQYPQQYPQQYQEQYPPQQYPVQSGGMQQWQQPQYSQQPQYPQSQYAQSYPQQGYPQYYGQQEQYPPQPQYPQPSYYPQQGYAQPYQQPAQQMPQTGYQPQNTPNFYPTQPDAARPRRRSRPADWMQ